MVNSLVTRAEAAGKDFVYKLWGMGPFCDAASERNENIRAFYHSLMGAADEDAGLSAEAVEATSALIEAMSGDDAREILQDVLDVVAQS
jgi:ABC-type branched-subunit amino acid transport system substrate-binding protein